MDGIGIGIDVGGTAVKLAVVDAAGSAVWTGRSSAYARPSRDELVAAVRQAAGEWGRGTHSPVAAAVGLCVPGVLDDRRRAVLQSVNLPSLNGLRLDELVGAALGAAPASVAVFTDAHATAYDLYTANRPASRMFVLAIGSGVGAAVLDKGIPLSVDADSPGHFGQLDVSLEGHPVIGPDGGAGSLEGYLSAASLARQFGPEWAERLQVTDVPMRALVRALRIAHAVYRPQHFYLAGGIGIRLAHLCPALRAAVAADLTRIARPDWTLAAGDSDFHAARGAARLGVPRG